MKIIKAKNFEIPQSEDVVTVHVGNVYLHIQNNESYTSINVNTHSATDVSREQKEVTLKEVKTEVKKSKVYCKDRDGNSVMVDVNVFEDIKE